MARRPEHEPADRTAGDRAAGHGVVVHALHPPRDPAAERRQVGAVEEAPAAEAEEAPSEEAADDEGDEEEKSE